MEDIIYWPFCSYFWFVLSEKFLCDREKKKEITEHSKSTQLQVFEVAPSLHMVELRKTGGDTLEFHKVCEGASFSLCISYMWMWNDWGANNYGLIIECSSTKTSLRDLRMLFGQRNNKVIEFAVGVFGTLVGVNFLLGVLKSWILWWERWFRWVRIWEKIYKDQNTFFAHGIFVCSIFITFLPSVKIYVCNIYIYVKYGLRKSGTHTIIFPDSAKSNHIWKPLV